MSGKCTKNGMDFHQFLLLIISQYMIFLNPCRVINLVGAIILQDFIPYGQLQKITLDR